MPFYGFPSGRSELSISYWNGEMTFNPKLCDERHTKIDKEFEDVWIEIKNQRNKLWAIIMLLVANLASLIIGILLVYGKSIVVY